MEGLNYEGELQAYREAIEDLYDRPFAYMRRGRGELLSPDQLEDRDELVRRAERVVETSSALGEALKRGLNNDDPSVRELAVLQLSAVANLDIAVANDLADRYGAEEGVFTTGTTGAQLPQVYPRVDSILTGSFEGGIEQVLGYGSGFFSANPSEEISRAKQRASKKANETIDEIRNEAADTCQVAIGGFLGGAGAGILAEAATLVPNEILNNLGNIANAVHRLLRPAISLLSLGIDKILSFVGEPARDFVQKQAGGWVLGWISEAVSGRAMQRALDAIYESNRIRQDIDETLEESTYGIENPAVYDDIADHLEALADRFAWQHRVLGMGVKGLSRAKSWLIALFPHSAPVVYGMLLIGVGCTVFLGGDYLDWYRTERFQALDVVQGVRNTVEHDIYHG